LLNELCTTSHVRRQAHGHGARAALREKPAPRLHDAEPAQRGAQENFAIGSSALVLVSLYASYSSGLSSS